MNQLALARVLAVLATAWALGLVALFGALGADYSHTGNFISELGASGAPFGAMVSWAGFLPVGLLVAAFLFVAAPLVPFEGKSRVGYWLLLAQSVAYVGAALAPCDLGCPAEGSFTQGIHNLVGIVTYLITGVALFLLASSDALSVTARRALFVAGIAWFNAFFLMLNPELENWRGLLQRVMEGTLWLLLLFIAFRLSKVRTSR